MPHNRYWGLRELQETLRWDSSVNRKWVKVFTFWGLRLRVLAMYFYVAGLRVMAKCFYVAELRVMTKYFCVADARYSCFPKALYNMANKPTFSVCWVLKLLKFCGGCAGVALCRTLDVKQGIMLARQTLYHLSRSSLCRRDSEMELFSIRGLACALCSWMLNHPFSPASFC